MVRAILRVILNLWIQPLKVNAGHGLYNGYFFFVVPPPPPGRVSPLPPQSITSDSDCDEELEPMESQSNGSIPDPLFSQCGPLSSNIMSSSDCFQDSGYASIYAVTFDPI